MAHELWQPIAAVAEDEQFPLLSTLTDGELAETVVNQLGLAGADFLGRGHVLTQVRALATGRVVDAPWLSPTEVDGVINRAAETGAGQDWPRWFSAAGCVLRLSAGEADTCGGSREIYSLKVFGSIPK